MLLCKWLQEKTGGFIGMFKKSPKPCPHSPVNKVKSFEPDLSLEYNLQSCLMLICVYFQDSLSDRQFLYGSCDSIPDLSEVSATVKEEQ